MRDQVIAAVEQELAEEAPLVVSPAQLTRSLGIQEHEAEALLRKLGRSSSALEVVPHGQAYMITISKEDR